MTLYHQKLVFHFRIIPFFNTECPTLTQPVNCTLMGNGRLIGHKVAYVFRNAQNWTMPIEHRQCMEKGVWRGNQQIVQVD